VAGGVVEDVLGVGGVFEGGSVGDEENVGVGFAAFRVGFLGDGGGFFESHASLVAFESALSGAGVETEDVGFGFSADADGVFESEGEADGDHVHFFFGQFEHFDFVIDGDAGGGHHFKDFGVVIHVGDGGADVGDGVNAHVFALLENHTHVFKRVVSVEAGADEGFAVKGGHDVLSGVVESLLIGVEDGPHHGHGAHTIRAEAGTGEGVDAGGASVTNGEKIPSMDFEEVLRRLIKDLELCRY